MRMGSLKLLFLALCLLFFSASVALATTNPNPCIQNSGMCTVSGTKCQVTGTGNSIGDASCPNFTCTNASDCNYRGVCSAGVCTCLGAYGGNKCEVLNRCKSDYSCNNGGTCVASTIYNEGIPGIDPVYSYVCEDCAAGFWPPTCSNTDQSMVVWSELIDIMSTDQNPFVRESDLCAQFLTPATCDENNQVVSFSVEPGSMNFFDFTATTNMVLPIIPLDFSHSSHLTYILFTNHFGAPWSYLSNLKPNFVPNLNAFICANECHLSGSVELNGFQYLTQVAVSGPVTSMQLNPYTGLGVGEFVPPLSQFQLYVQDLTTCDVEFPISQYTALQGVGFACLGGISCQIMPGEQTLNDWFSSSYPNNYFPNLQLILFTNTFFYGSLPPDLYRIAPAMTMFSCDNCSLTGDIPSTFFNSSGVLSYDLSNNALTGTIDTAEIVSLSTLTKFFINNNQLTGYMPDLRGSGIADYHLQNNDWYCTENMTDTSEFDYLSACNVTGPCANFTEICTLDQGLCKIESGGCTCLPGFFNYLCHAYTPTGIPGCILDSASHYFYDYLFNHVQPAVDPGDYNTFFTTALGGALDCTKPICEWANSAASSNSYLFTSLETFTHPEAYWSFNTKTVKCDLHGNLQTLILNFENSLTVPTPNLTYFPALQNFQLYAPSSTDTGNTTEIGKWLSGMPSSMRSVFLGNSGLYGSLGDPEFEQWPLLGYLRIQQNLFDNTVLGPQLAVTDAIWTNLPSLFYVSLNGFYSEAGFSGLGNGITAASNLRLLDLTPLGPNSRPGDNPYIDPRDPTVWQILGNVSPNLFNLTHIQAIYLSDTGMRGQLPSNLSSTLSVISLMNTNFYGVLPVTALDAVHPDYLYVSGSEFFCPPTWVNTWGSLGNDSVTYETLCWDYCDNPANASFANCDPETSNCTEAGTCRCLNGYSGTRCNIPPTGPCSTATCDFSNSNCVDLGEGAYTCLCDAAFYGANCNISVTGNVIFYAGDYNLNSDIAVYPNQTDGSAQAIVAVVVSLWHEWYVANATLNVVVVPPGVLASSSLPPTNTVEQLLLVYMNGPTDVQALCAGTEEVKITVLSRLESENLEGPNTLYDLRPTLQRFICQQPPSPVQQNMTATAPFQRVPSGTPVTIDISFDPSGGFSTYTITQMHCDGYVAHNSSWPTETVLAGLDVWISTLDNTTFYFYPDAHNILSYLPGHNASNSLFFTLTASCNIDTQHRDSKGHFIIASYSLLLTTDVELLPGSCTSVMCGNHSSCVIPTYTCECNPGWYGSHCNSPFPTPCDNPQVGCVVGQSTCVNVNEDDYRCDCHGGWYGTNCDLSLTANVISHIAYQNLPSNVGNWLPLSGDSASAGVQAIFAFTVALPANFSFVQNTNNLTVNETYATIWNDNLGGPGNVQEVIVYVFGQPKTTILCAYSGGDYLYLDAWLVSSNPADNLVVGNTLVHLGDIFLDNNPLACEIDGPLRQDPNSNNLSMASGDPLIIPIVWNPNDTTGYSGVNVTCNGAAAVIYTGGTTILSYVPPTAIISENQTIAYYPDLETLRALVPGLQSNQTLKFELVMQCDYNFDPYSSRSPGGSFIVWTNATVATGFCDNVTCNGNRICDAVLHECICQPGLTGANCNETFDASFTLEYDLTKGTVAEGVNGSVLIINLGTAITYPLYLTPAYSLSPAGNFTFLLTNAVNDSSKGQVDQVIMLVAYSQSVMTWLCNQNLPSSAYPALNFTVRSFDPNVAIPVEWQNGLSVTKWHEAVTTCPASNAPILPGAYIAFDPVESGGTPSAPLSPGASISWDIVPVNVTASDIAEILCLNVIYTASSGNLTTLLFIGDLEDNGSTDNITSFTPDIARIASYPEVHSSGGLVTFYYHIYCIVGMTQEVTPSQSHARKRAARQGTIEGEVISGNGTFSAPVTTTTTRPTTTARTTTRVSTTTTASPHSTTNGTVGITTTSSSPSTTPPNTTTSGHDHPTTPSDGSNTGFFSGWVFVMVFFGVVIGGAIVWLLISQLLVMVG